MRLKKKGKAYIFRRFFYACMLLLGLLGTFRAQAAPPIEIQSEVLEQVIDGNTEFIFDASSMHTVQTIQAVTEWREPDGEPFSKGLDEGVMWLRFRLVNPTNQSEERALQFSNGHADRLTVWITDENSGTEKFEIGQDAPLQERPIKHFIPRVPIRVDAGAQKSVVLRIEDEGTMSGSLQLAKLDILQSQEMSSHLVTGLMTGIFGLMGIYAFALFLWLRKPIFGWLSALAICSLLQWMVFNWGEAGLLVPVESRAWLTNRLIIVFLSGSVFCTFLFYVEACSLRVRFPRLSKLILWFAWFELSNAFLVFVLPYIQSVRILFFGAVGFLALVCAVLY
ncbi:MAG: 7TM-DISM domain-containing protein, partial [Myxococcota bacterium]|nr:7TM-DISM domain-containing protein [Myxococcota bacterium]